MTDTYPVCSYLQLCNTYYDIYMFSWLFYTIYLLVQREGSEPLKFYLFQAGAQKRFVGVYIPRSVRYKLL